MPLYSMTAKYVVGIASGLSGVAIVVALFSAFIIVQDINSLYDEIMDDMVEFKGLANDAWVGMIAHSAPLSRQERAIPFRARRQGYGGASEAGVGSSSGSAGGSQGGSSCPAGPPGVSLCLKSL